MRINQVKVIEVDDESELNKWLEENPGWIPFSVIIQEDTDRLLQKNYFVWLRYGGR